MDDDIRGGRRLQRVHFLEFVAFCAYGTCGATGVYSPFNKGRVLIQAECIRLVPKKNNTRHILSVDYITRV
jgi:hypothetical protein